MRNANSENKLGQKKEIKNHQNIKGSGDFFEGKFVTRASQKRKKKKTRSLKHTPIFHMHSKKKKETYITLLL